MTWGFGDEPPSDATAYAYNDNWSRLKIVNLAALEHYKTVLNPWVDFKAFVKSFRDNFIPGWQETQYPNQSVPIAHQSMPKRSIQVEWTVPSTNINEAMENLQKCSWLAQSMYPILKSIRSTHCQVLSQFTEPDSMIRSLDITKSSSRILHWCQVMS